MRENPTLVMQHFSELAASLNTYENRNKSVGASVESIFLHMMPTARVNDAMRHWRKGPTMLDGSSEWI